MKKPKQKPKYVWVLLTTVVDDALNPEVEVFDSKDKAKASAMKGFRVDFENMEFEDAGYKFEDWLKEAYTLLDTPPNETVWDSEEICVSLYRRKVNETLST